MAANNRWYSRLRVCVHSRIWLRRATAVAATGNRLFAQKGETRRHGRRVAYGHTTVWVGLHFGAALTTMILVHQLSMNGNGCPAKSTTTCNRCGNRSTEATA